MRIRSSVAGAAALLFAKPSVPALERKRGAIERTGLRRKPDGSRLSGPGTHDYERESAEGVALGSLERLKTGRITVVCSYDFARTFDFEPDMVVRTGNGEAVLSSTRTVMKDKS